MAGHNNDGHRGRGYGGRRRTQVDVGDRRGGMRVDHERLNENRVHVVLQRAQNREYVPQKVDTFQGGDCEGRQE